MGNFVLYLFFVLFICQNNENTKKNEVFRSEFPALQSMRAAGDSKMFGILCASANQIDVLSYNGRLLDSIRNEIPSETFDFVDSGNIIFPDAKSPSGKIIVYDIQNKKNARYDTLNNPISILRAIGRLSYIAVGSVKGEFGLFDFKKSQLVWSIGDTKGEVDDIFVDDKHRFLGLRIGYGIQLLDFANGKEKKRFREVKGNILANGFSNEDLIWFSESGFLTQINSNTFVSKKTRIMKDELPSCAAFSKDGSWLAIGGFDGVVRIRSTRGEKFEQKIVMSPKWEVKNIVFSPNNEHLIVHTFNKKLAVLGKSGSVLSIMKLTLPKPGRVRGAAPR